jgi:hypothetical protein
MAFIPSKEIGDKVEKMDSTHYVANGLGVASPIL